MRGVGRVRRKLSELIFDVLSIDVAPEDLYSIPNGGSVVYDPPRWEGYGRRSPSGEQVRLHSWSKMADLVKYGIGECTEEYQDIEVFPKEPS